MTSAADSTPASAANHRSEPPTGPVWLDDSHLDPAWLRSRVPNLPSDIEVLCVDISNETRQGSSPRQGATLQVRVLAASNEQSVEPCRQTFILKQVPDIPASLALSQQLGLAREALFYQHLMPVLMLGKGVDESILPRIYYADGSFESGHKWVLMEDLKGKAVDSGILFGPSNPNNANRGDLNALWRKTAGDDVLKPTSRQVALETFQVIAKVHAAFWKHAPLLEYPWLRAAGWVQGRDEASWQASQDMVLQIWTTKVATAEKDKPLLAWDPLVRAAVDKAIRGISWEAQQKRLNEASHWTLVHGDFWPGNALWMIRTSSGQQHIKLLDWEMTGIGSGPQDLGQYILSNMNPKERRECERELIQAYWETLQEGGVSGKDVTFEYCWNEYRVGGLERWLWFLVYFLGQDTFITWAQFFHNQIAAFMHDHGLTADDITQPRP